MTLPKPTRRFALLIAGATVLLGSGALATPATAAVPDPTGTASWQLLAAGERASVLAPTGHDVTTPHNGSEWYFNVSESIGFAPAGAPIEQDSADIAATGPTDATTPYRLSWHASDGEVFGGWRVGGDTSLNNSTEFFRAVYEADTLPAYYPFGPQLDVSTSDLTGWTQCWLDTYASEITTTDLWAQCDGAYLLFAGGQQTTAVDVSVAGVSVLDHPSGTQTTDVVPGNDLELAVPFAAWSDFIVYTSLCEGEGCEDTLPEDDLTGWSPGVLGDASYLVGADDELRTLAIYAADDETGEPDFSASAVVFISVAPVVIPPVVPPAPALAATGASVDTALAAAAALLAAGIGILAFARRRTAHQN